METRNREGAGNAWKRDQGARALSDGDLGRLLAPERARGQRAAAAYPDGVLEELDDTVRGLVRQLSLDRDLPAAGRGGDVLERTR